MNFLSVQRWSKLWGCKIIPLFRFFRAMIELKGFYSLEKPGDFHNLVDVQVSYLAMGDMFSEDCIIKYHYHFHSTCLQWSTLVEEGTTCHRGSSATSSPSTAQSPLTMPLITSLAPLPRWAHGFQSKSHIDVTLRDTSTPTVGSQTTWPTWCSCWSRWQGRCGRSPRRRCFRLPPSSTTSST